MGVGASQRSDYEGSSAVGVWGDPLSKLYELSTEEESNTALIVTDVDIVVLWVGADATRLG